MPPYHKPLTVERDTEAAFRAAILAGVLSAAPKDRNWAGHYRSSAGSGMADRRRGRSLRTARFSRTPRRPSPHRGARQADGDRVLSACYPSRSRAAADALAAGPMTAGGLRTGLLPRSIRPTVRRLPRSPRLFPSRPTHPPPAQQIERMVGRTGEGAHLGHEGVV